MTKSNILAALICLFALVSFGQSIFCFSSLGERLTLFRSAGGIWTTALIVQVKLFARKEELHWSALVWFLAAVVSDVLITMTLVISLVGSGFNGFEPRADPLPSVKQEDGLRGNG